MKDTKYLSSETTPKSKLVSVSQLQSFMSCKKKWQYGYIDNLTPRVDRTYLTVGKLCHKGMQVAMQNLWKDQRAGLDTTQDGGLFNSWLNKAIEAMQEEYDKYCATTPHLEEEIPEFEQLWIDAEAVFTQAFEEFEPWKYEVISVVKDGKIAPALELHFEVPCVMGVRMHGFIDAILRDRETGFTWCTDYKFRKSLSPDGDEAFNIQNAVYTHACAMMKISITGTMTWQHVNTPAADPLILKDGKISRAKIKTTWKHFEQFCRDHGADPQDYYLEMEEKLRDIEFFRPTYEYRNPETVKNMWTECIIPTVYELMAAKKPKAKNHPSLYPWNCKMCQFQSLCQAELRNYDVSAIIEREYMRR